MPYKPQNRVASLASGEEYYETESEVYMPFNLALNSQNPLMKKAVCKISIPRYGSRLQSIIDRFNEATTMVTMYSLH